MVTEACGWEGGDGSVGIISSLVVCFLKMGLETCGWERGEEGVKLILFW